MTASAPFTHVWRWKNRLPGRFGQRCRILFDYELRGQLWIEFMDGYRTYCSYFAVRRYDAKRDATPPAEQLSLGIMP